MSVNYIFTNSKLHKQKKHKIIFKEKNIYLYSAQSKTSLDEINFFCKNNLVVIILGKIVAIKNKKFNIENFLSNISKFSLTNYENLLSSFEGNFNIIVYDKIKKKLFFARDIEACNPLYYKITKKNFWISNSPKNLFFNCNLNTHFCKQYLFYRYNYVYGKKSTFFKQISYVEAASYVYLNNSKIKIKRYWDKYFDKKKFYHLSYKRAKTKTLSILKKTFLKLKLKNCILALSGGLDSSSVAAIFNINKQKLPSFTAFYNSNNIVDETAAAKKIADINCKDWRKIEINSKDFLKEWKKCYKIFSFPVCTSSFVGYLILYHKINKIGYNKIINAGTGDHFFLGNFPIFKYFLADLHFNKKKSFKNELNLWIKNFSTLEFPKSKNLFFNFINAEKLKKDDEFFKFTPKVELTGSKYLNKSFNIKKQNIFKGSSFIDAYQKQSIWYSERQPGLLPFQEIEEYLDVKSVDPFNEINLKNFFYNMNPLFKIKNGVGKKILRDVLKEYLPKSIIENKKKIGFNVPFAEWMYKDKDLYRYILKHIYYFKNLPIKNLVKIDKLIFDYKSKKQCLMNTENSMFIWQLVNLTMWYLKFFKNNGKQNFTKI